MNNKKTPELSPRKFLPPRLSLAVQYASAARNLPTRAQFRRWVKIALKHDVAMTLRIVDEAEGRELNRKYRSRDYATNVLTFVYDDEQTPPSPPLSGEEPYSPPDKGGWGVAFQPLHGDVVICAPVVEREAAAQHKDLFAHYAHLAIHAALHLQGYEHENDIDAAGMEALETELMLKLRYPDPYQTTRIANERPRK
ncbi:MAG: rRNA maturation RNase YbeY [Gallionella sp.]